MKIISWNINGVRAVIKKDFKKWLAGSGADIVCLQEIKIGEIALAKEDISFDGYETYWHSAQRPGYSGTAILVKEELEKPKRIEFPDDDEGRTLILEFKDYFLVNVYFPNANRELSRMGFKIAYNDRLLAFLKNLEKKKPLIICGDYNVAQHEIDLVRPKENIGNAGFTSEERSWMNKFVDSGFVDTFRDKYPDKVQYTWWSYMRQARVRNIGWRIDYFCVSEKMREKIKDAFILDQVMGSDHCPLGINL